MPRATCIKRWLDAAALVFGFVFIYLAFDWSCGSILLHLCTIHATIHHHFMTIPFQLQSLRSGYPDEDVGTAAAVVQNLFWKALKYGVYIGLYG